MTERHKDIKESDIIERMRAVPRYEPGLMFRLKVFMVTTFPSLEYSRARTTSRQNGWGSRFELSGHGRIAVAGAMALVLAFLIFSSLVLVSGNSLPGSPLYSLKRAREKVGLALTWSQAAKAEKHLTLASNRLGELDSMAGSGQIDPDSVESIAKDYNSDTAAVTRMLQENPASPQSKEIARELQALQTQKTNMVRRLAAEAPSGVLASADGASIKVTDTGSSGVLGPTPEVQGTTNEKGEFLLDVDASDPAKLTALDVKIEKDGRKAIVPVFAAARGNEKYAVTVAPEVQVVKVNQPVEFALKIAPKDGSSLGQKRVKLIDSSRTCLIDGKPGEAALWTDSSGSCSFSLVKTSDSEVSRISLQVEDGGWVSAGQLMAVGGLVTSHDSGGTGAVSATSSGSQSSPQSVELNNGKVRAIARKSSDGEVLRGVVAVGSASEAGPLLDPVVVEGRALGGSVTVDGPRVTFTNEKAAGYEIAFDLSIGGGSIRKTYQVILASGDPFVTVNCSVSVSGGAIQVAKDNPGLLVTDVLKRPAGATVEVGGQKAEGVLEPGKSSLYAFQVGNPYVAFGTGNGIVFAACPIDSESYPDSWLLTSDTVTPKLSGSSSALAGGFKTTMILGVTDKEGLESVIGRSRNGIGDPSSSANTPVVESTDGFTVLTIPGLDKLSRGKQPLTLKILKQYEQVFQKF